MASQNSALFLSQLDQSSSTRADYASGQALAGSTEAGGQVRVIADTHLTTSAVTTSENLVLCKLPAGAKVVGGFIHVPGSAGPSGASKIGIGTIAYSALGVASVTVTDDNRYGTVSNINAAAGSYAFQAATGSDFDVAPSDTEYAIVFTPVGASLATATTIGWTIYYTTA